MSETLKHAMHFCLQAMCSVVHTRPKNKQKIAKNAADKSVLNQLQFASTQRCKRQDELDDVPKRAR
jgi:hypothetical protein